MVRKAAGEYSKTKEEQLRFAFPSYHYEGNFSGKQVVELKGAYYELASWLNCNYIYGIQVFHTCPCHIALAYSHKEKARSSFILVSHCSLENTHNGLLY